MNFKNCVYILVEEFKFSQNYSTKLPKFLQKNIICFLMSYPLDLDSRNTKKLKKLKLKRLFFFL